MFEMQLVSVLSFDCLCSGKTTQLLNPVTWKDVRHILSFTFKPKDSLMGVGDT